MKIAHIASHRINIGDGAIIQTIQRFAPQHEYINLDIVDFINDNRIWMAEYLDSLECDRILVGGGGSIDGGWRPESGFAFRMPVEEVEKIRTPMAFVGIGHNVRSERYLQYPERLGEFILKCQDRGFPFSVREDGSKERIKKNLGIDVEEIPDPGFFVKTQGGYSSVFIPEGHVVIVQVNGLKDPMPEYWESMAAIVASIIGSGAQVVFAPHTLDDHLAIGNILKISNLQVLRRSMTGILQCLPPSEAHLFFNNYKRASLVVGMRGHSVICATGLGIPVIGLDYFPKVRGYMERLGISEWCIDINGENFVDEVIDAMNSALYGTQVGTVGQYYPGALIRFNDFMKRALYG